MIQGVSKKCTHTLTVANILSFLLMELSLVRDTLTCFKSLLVHKLLRCLVITARCTFSKMEHFPHYHRDAQAHLGAAFPDTWIGRRGAIEYPACSPHLTPLDFFCGDISKTKFIAPNQEQLMHWKWKLKDNIAIFLMTCFVTFANPLVCIISVVWTMMVVNSNICKHGSLIKFVFCIWSYSISLYVHK